MQWLDSMHNSSAEIQKKMGMQTDLLVFVIVWLRQSFQFLSEFRLEI